MNVFVIHEALKLKGECERDIERKKSLMDKNNIIKIVYWREKIIGWL
jgi:hypothetical protein